MHKSPTPEPFAHLHLAVPPLPFDSEDQLLSVLARLRAQLSLALAQKWSTQGGDPALLPSINNFVINEFFDKLGPIIFKNSTIKGQLHHLSKPKNKTEPFSEVLHERVLKYQDQLFETRTQNVIARKEMPIAARQTVKRAIKLDNQALQLKIDRNALSAVLPDVQEDEAPPTKRRKSTKGEATAGPSNELAEEEFNKGRLLLDQLALDLPMCLAEASKAQQVIEQVSNLS